MQKRKFIIYVLFWSLYLLPDLFRLIFNLIEINWVLIAGNTALSVLVFYLVAEIFMPRLTRPEARRGIWLAGISLGSLIFAWVHMRFEQFVMWKCCPEKMQDHQFYFIDYFTGMFWFMAVVASISFVRLWYEIQIKTEELQHLQTQAELNMLRYRINPYFLFNTLNSLYALATEKSEKTPQVILQLASLMRYMLQNDKDQILLSSELEYLEHYIALERLRLGDEVDITMQIHGNPGHHTIAPMLLLPFVENTFKHGISSASRVGHVEIQAQITENEFYFYVENSKPLLQTFETGAQLEYLAGLGQGLATVKRRLELLYAKERYQLDIDDSEDKYVVNLYIKLN